MINYKDITPEDLLSKSIRLSDIKPLTDDDFGLVFTKGPKHKLPSWYCFIIYILTSSSQRAAEYIKSTGVKTKQDKFYAPQTILLGVWEWVIFNLEKAKPFFVRDFEVLGKDFSDEKFYLIVIQRAVMYKMILNDKKLANWLLENKLTDEVYLEAIKQKRPEVYKYLTAGSI